jgi:hypothetical protein
MESNDFGAKTKKEAFKSQQDFRFFAETKWRKRITRMSLRWPTWIKAKQSIPNATAQHIYIESQSP